MSSRSKSSKSVFLIALCALVLSLWNLWQGCEKGSCFSETKSCGGTPKSLEIEQVEKALLTKPEMIVKAIEAYSSKQKAQHSEEKKEEIKKQAKVLFDDAASPYSGNKKADVTLVSFFDYRCGYCRRGSGVLEEIVGSDANVKVVYKEFPIFGEDSLMSKAALAAHKQGRYVDFHKALMNSKGSLNMDGVKAIAEKLKLDLVRFEADLKDPSIADQIKANIKLAETLDINSTPSLIVNDGTIHSGMLTAEQMREIISKARSGKLL